MAGERRIFDFYGLRLAVTGAWPDVLEAVGRDFAWFAVDGDGDADTVARVERRPPDYESLRDAVSVAVTERNVVFHQDGRTIVDYLGAAVSVHDPGARTLLVQGEDESAVHRALFDFLLAQAATRSEAIGLTRVTGLGLAGPSAAILVKLPPGGGKTTLALRALEEPSVSLLSENGPLLDRQGRLHSFPLPLWIRDSAPEAEDVPQEHLRLFGRRRSDPRILELSAFVDRVEREPKPLRHVVLGRRSLGLDSELRPLGRRGALVPLARDAAMGFGFAVGFEFFRRHGLRQAVGSPRSAARRVRHCAVPFLRADVWELVLGRDREANWQALEPLLR